MDSENFINFFNKSDLKILNFWISQISKNILNDLKFFELLGIEKFTNIWLLKIFWEYSILLSSGFVGSVDILRPNKMVEQINSVNWDYVVDVVNEKILQISGWKAEVD